MDITPELAVEAVLELSKGAKDVLVHHFGPGVLMPGQTWTTESLEKAAMIRGVDLQSLLDDLKKATREL